MKFYNIDLNLRNHIQILKKGFNVINLNKIINYLGIHLETLLIKKKCVFKPYSAIIESSNLCNLKCKLCLVNQSNSKFKKEFLSFEKYKLFIDSNPQLIFLLFTGFGEPSLNPELKKFIDYAKYKRIISVLSTNGTIDISNINPDFVIFFSRLYRRR
jgi:sulfatase maturation enzyme AslB (radical SAM superfamily)